MTLNTRRSFVVSAATAGALFGLSRPLEIISPAAAQRAGKKGGDADAAPRTYKTFKLGDLQITTVYDGIWEKAHDPGFIKNASVEETKRALVAGGLTDAHVPITFTVTAIKRGNDITLIDSGTGGQASPKAGAFLDNLKAAGIDKDKVKTICISHYHPDHIFGLMEKDTNRPIFPNAEIVVPAAEHAWWTDQSVFTKLPEVRHGLAKRIQATLATWKNVRVVDGERELTRGVRALPAFGHTPGHTAHLVSSGRNVMIVSADSSNIPALFVRNPGWHAQFDADAAMAEASRRRLFDRAVTDGTIIAGYHWGMPGAGRLKKDGKGYIYLPLA